MLDLPGDPGKRMLLYSAEPGRATTSWPAEAIRHSVAFINEYTA
jgi:hypothetical protein